MSDAKYLKITIYDNDFTGYWHILAEAVHSMIMWMKASDDLEDIDMDRLANGIQEIWSGLNKSMYALEPYRRRKYFQTDTSMDCFKPYLSIVNYSDIPEWENGEVIYVPLFEGESLIR